MHNRRSVLSADTVGSRVPMISPLEAYARSVGELARINALLEGFDPTVAKKREALIYHKTLREGLDDPVHPHAERLSPK